MQGDARGILNKKRGICGSNNKKRIQDGIVQQQKEDVALQIDNLGKQSITNVVGKEGVMPGTLVIKMVFMLLIEP